MACLAGNPGMGIARHFFIMGKVALTAISRLLSIVVKGRRLWMTGRAGYSGMGRGIIFFPIYQGD